MDSKDIINQLGMLEDLGVTPDAKGFKDGIQAATVLIKNFLTQQENQQGQKEFDKGYAAAVANLINLHGDMVSARETFLQNFDSIKDIKKLGVSEFDLEILSKHF